MSNVVVTDTPKGVRALLPSLDSAAALTVVTAPPFPGEPEGTTGAEREGLWLLRGLTDGGYKEAILMRSINDRSRLVLQLSAVVGVMVASYVASRWTHSELSMLVLLCIAFGGMYLFLLRSSDSFELALSGLFAEKSVRKKSMASLEMAPELAWPIVLRLALNSLPWSLVVHPLLLQLKGVLNRTDKKILLSAMSSLSPSQQVGLSRLARRIYTVQLADDAESTRVALDGDTNELVSAALDALRGEPSFPEPLVIVPEVVKPPKLKPESVVKI